MPLHLGKEERFGTSRIRKVEAQSIAKEVRRIVDACGQTISIGIISFYRSQCDQILQSLLKVSLATEEDGELAIARNYRKTDSGEESTIVISPINSRDIASERLILSLYITY